MGHIQQLVQTQNEKKVSYVMLGLGLLVTVLFVVYVSLMYQTTQVAYGISKQEKEASVYLDTVAQLENTYHNKKRFVTKEDASRSGFAKIGEATYVSVNTETYSLAR